ncbi:hypothetical protein DWV12_18610, partial [Clostridium botulinum]|uniref:hypothetical protein n=1 Tax=Clostridium botulinum TaxID=1491 RepID=UPI00217CED13
KQLVMYLGVRKPVVDANRSGCSYEIPGMTWFCQAEKESRYSQEWSNSLFNYSQAGWYHGKLIVPVAIIAAGTFFIQGVRKMIISTCGGNPRY